MKGCLSIFAHIGEVTPDQYVRLEALYQQLLTIQGRSRAKPLSRCRRVA